MKNLLDSPIVLALVAGIFLVNPASATVSIDYVSVGNAGNAADSTTSYGAVAYDYKIARNETTLSQYAEFLNAAAKTDSYGLYNANMASSINLGSLITQSGSSGSYVYSVASGRDNLPVAYVSWFDAARFTNWLQNGQQTGVGAALTAETGAYTLNGATSGIITKNVGATVWIPSEDEWYKAAFYDPNKGGAGVGGYWLQATQSVALAGNTAGVADSANYYDGDYAVSGTPAYPAGNALTNVGAYGANSQSAYGTNDQAGNLYEWNDTVSGPDRGQRGGSWFSGASDLASSTRSDILPSVEDYAAGFRVASVPEPSALLLTMVAVGASVVKRRRSAL